MTDKLLRLPSVQQLYPMSRAHIYAEQKAGRFPKGVRIGKRAVAWKQSEIQAFIESKATELPPRCVTSIEARLDELERDVLRLTHEVRDLRREAEGATHIAVAAIKRSADPNLTIDLPRSDLGDEQTKRPLIFNKRQVS